MKIKQLKVYKTEPCNEIIRDIEFNEKGLNLIVDYNISDKKSDSGNDVGKTTAIRIIDLCLGGKSTKNLYYDSEMKTTNETVKQFLDNHKVQAELVVSDGKIEHKLVRDLFYRGKAYLDDSEMNLKDYCKSLRKIFFGSQVEKPSFRELISKFIRLDSISEDKILKYLPQTTKNEDYKIIYGFLFHLTNDDLLSKKGILNKAKASKKRTLDEMKKKIGSEVELSKQLDNVLEDIGELNIKKQNIVKYEKYKRELEKKSELLSQIDELQNIKNMILFEINNISECIDTLKSEKNDIDLNALKAIYSEAQCYIPQLQKDFDDMVVFHNSMIKNRVIFFETQLEKRKDECRDYDTKINNLLEEVKRHTLTSFQEGFIAKLEEMNKELENLNYKKGELSFSIDILKRSNIELNNVKNEIDKIDKEIKNKNKLDNISKFNKIFSSYCKKLYNEEYLFVYDDNEKESICISKMEGNIGTGKRKALILAFDLAYVEFAVNSEFITPAFIIHDKMESVYFEQLKTIFEICETSQCQYIVPILSGKIDELEWDDVKSSIILKLGPNDKFFKI